MDRAQYLFLRHASDELADAVRERGRIDCGSSIHVACLPADLQEKFKSFRLTFVCEYDSSGQTDGDVLHSLKNAAISLQLVRPVSDFLRYWVPRDLDTARKMEQAALHLPIPGPDPYLRYQQHHQIEMSDIQRLKKILPSVQKARSQGGPAGLWDSWTHPDLPIHRALVFFGQGYGVNLGELRQPLWAAGLDSLYASKLKRSLQSPDVILKRVEIFLGSNFQPYKAVAVPGHQRRPSLRVAEIVKDIFRLRNDYMHGCKISDPRWLSGATDPENGYAYQLVECTEILLRFSLLKILDNPRYYKIFRDPNRLDQFFGLKGT
jgi:hypothetical protein